MFGSFGNNMAVGAQQNLPANPIQITQPWYNVNLNSPPYIPRVTIDPQLQSLVPLISSTAAMEIQQQAQAKQNQPLRVFMHNLYSTNGFQNEHFESLLAACLDFVWVNVGKGQYPSVEQAIADGVPKVIEMLAGMQPAMYPALVPYLDQPTLAAASQLQQVFNAVSMEIKAIKQRQGFGAAMNTAAQMGGGFAGGQGGQFVPVGMGPRFGGGGGINMPTTPNTLITGGSPSLFGGGGRQVAFGGDQRAPLTPSRYDEKILRQPLGKKEQPVQQIAAVVDVEAHPVTAAASAEPELIPAAKVKWQPNQDYPYVPAYNPQQVQLFFKIKTNGQFEPVLEKTNPMDYERHAVSPTFGPRAVGFQPSQAAQVLERIRKNIEQINEPPAEEEVGTSETPRASLPFSSVVRDYWMIESSELPMWIAGDIERLSTRVGDEQSIPDIYRFYAKVAYPVVGVHDESSWVRSFADSKTFLELREKLLQSGEKISSALWSAANTRITRAINRMLRYNLSLPVLNIDSFVDDIEDLVQVLQKRYGDFLSEAFLRHQQEHIRRIFGVPDTEEANDLTSTMIDPSEYQTIEPPQITYMSSNCSFTLLNCRAHELNIELGPIKVAAVHQSIVPVVHELVRGLFKATDEVIAKATEEALARGQEPPAPFDRHLIRTNDGRVLEASRGYLGQDFYVLALVE